MIGWILIALLVLLALVFMRALLELALLALFVCLAVALVRTLWMKPTAAKTAQPPVSDPQRAKAYGEKLAEMVKMETVSSRFDPDRTKFHAFQARLKDLFPRVFEACEVYHPGDGLVLLLRSEQPKGEPILLVADISE